MIVCGRPGCGLEIRRIITQPGTEIGEWRHEWPQDHRPLLGTPVLERIIDSGVRELDEDDATVVVEPPPPPLLPALVPMRAAHPDEIPRTARTLLKLAAARGWAANPPGTTFVRGYTADKTGMAKHVIFKEPRIGDDGRQEMTEKGNPRFKRIKMPALIVVESLAIRLIKGEQRVWAVWSDGKFDSAQASHPRRLLKSPELTALIKGE